MRKINYWKPEMILDYSKHKTNLNIVSYMSIFVDNCPFDVCVTTNANRNTTTGYDSFSLLFGLLWNHSTKSSFVQKRECILYSITINTDTTACEQKTGFFYSF